MHGHDVRALQRIRVGYSNHARGQVEGLSPDKAYCDGKSLDVSKAFYPLSQVPVLGSTFYFKQNEAFSKPGATVQLYVAPAVAPTAPPGTTGSSSGGSGGTTAVTPVALLHTINWEYWNGYEWKLLLQSPINTNAGILGDFTQTEVITFTVPSDLVATSVNNDNGFWIRARLAGGGYGLYQTIQFTSGNNTYSIPYVQPQPPIVAVFRFGYSWTQGPYALEQVFTYNDFQFEDHTNDARWPGNPFLPYQPVGDVTPALYLGFDKQLPVNNFGMYFDIVEQAGVSAGPAMIWEYWDGGDWVALSFEDETQQLSLAGMITFIPAADSQAVARFDNPLYWIRGRLKEDGPPNETTINNIYTNAVWASQWQTFSDSPLGASTGVPNQIFQFNQIPILPGQEIEIQELTAPRANTEWRTLAMQVAPADPNIVTKFEALLAAEGPQTDIIIGNIHLVRDKTKSVIEVWIEWQEEEKLF